MSVNTNIGRGAGGGGSLTVAARERMREFHSLGDTLYSVTLAETRQTHTCRTPSLKKDPDPKLRGGASVYCLLVCPDEP